MKFCYCIYSSYKDTKFSTGILPADLCLCLIVQNSVQKIFFQFDFSSSFWRKQCKKLATLLFLLGSELQGGKGRQTDIIVGFQYLSRANVVSCWTHFQYSWEVLTRFQLFLVVTTLAPPSPNVKDSPSHTEPIWPSHVPFLDPSIVLLARGGQVSHRAEQRSSVSKEGKWYQCLPWCAFTFYLFHVIKFAFKSFPFTFAYRLAPFICLL